MSEMTQKKDYRRITITIPKHLENKLREYQASQLIEDSRYSSFSKLVAGLLTESLVTKHENPYYGD
jgi:hypothetical protein